MRTHDFGRDMQLQRVQGQVDEVVGVMKNNITKVMERGDRLDELQDKSGKCRTNLVKAGQIWLKQDKSGNSNTGFGKSSKNLICAGQVWVTTRQI